MGGMSTQTIAEFLLERIAEDERHASKLAETDRRPVLSLATTINHPQRLLADCAAKRAIIEEHELGERSNGIRSYVGCVLCNYDRDYGWDEPGPCKTLRALAAVYADHEDYQQEWAL